MSPAEIEERRDEGSSKEGSSKKTTQDCHDCKWSEWQNTAGCKTKKTGHIMKQIITSTET